jgi:hypothetical protein
MTIYFRQQIQVFLFFTLIGCSDFNTADSTKKTIWKKFDFEQIDSCILDGLMIKKRLLGDRFLVEDYILHFQDFKTSYISNYSILLVDCPNCELREFIEKKYHNINDTISLPVVYESTLLKMNASQDWLYGGYMISINDCGEILNAVLTQ